MNRILNLLAISSALLLGVNALAAPAPLKYSIKDSSPETLMTAPVANAIWLAALPSKAPKHYPIKKYGYLSEVNGGFDESKTCVIVARAMVVPTSGKNFIYDPKKTAVTIGTKAAASAEQCSELAKGKLKEAVEAVVSSLNS